MSEWSFTAVIEIIGINPYVQVPEIILEELFKQCGKNKGTIPIKGTVNGLPYTQTLVKFKGLWRFYINTSMLKNSPSRVGETVEITFAFDLDERTIVPHPCFVKALEENPDAKAVFHSLSPSRQHEIVRYIASLKTEESILRNISRSIDFLNGDGRFVGRDKP
jgi:hypothetical protein